MMVFSLSVACPQSNSRTQYAFDLLHLAGENLKDEPLTILREGEDGDVTSWLLFLFRRIPARRPWPSK